MEGEEQDEREEEKEIRGGKTKEEETNMREQDLMVNKIVKGTFKKVQEYILQHMPKTQQR